VANRLLRRVRDYAQVHGADGIDEAVASQALGALEVDSLGLDRLDREILTALCKTFKGSPVGLSTLSAAVSEDSHTIEDVYEPFLLKVGLIQRTPRGRVATAAAWEHLGLDLPSGEATLFQG
jgi:Holliday junction DNA helicase RuvB